MRPVCDTLIPLFWRPFVSYSIDLSGRVAFVTGASGGLGAGIAGLLGGRLHPRFEVVMRYLDLDALIARADLVITAKVGALDDDTARIDLTVAFDGTTVLGKAQVRVRRHA